MVIKKDGKFQFLTTHDAFDMYTADPSMQYAGRVSHMNLTY